MEKKDVGLEENLVDSEAEMVGNMSRPSGGVANADLDSTGSVHTPSGEGDAGEMATDGEVSDHDSRKPAV